MTIFQKQVQNNFLKWKSKFNDKSQLNQFLKSEEKELEKINVNLSRNSFKIFNFVLRNKHNRFPIDCIHVRLFMRYPEFPISISKLPTSPQKMAVSFWFPTLTTLAVPDSIFSIQWRTVTSDEYLYGRYIKLVWNRCL